MSVATTIDLRSHAAEINEQHRAAETSYGHALAHAFEAGRLLAEAKGSLPHGEWTPWLAANVEFSERTARVYLQIAGSPEAVNRQSSAVLSIAAALRQVTKPREPQPDRLSAGEIADAFRQFAPTVDGPRPQAARREALAWSDQQDRKRGRLRDTIREAEHLIDSAERLSGLGIPDVLRDAGRLLQRAAVAADDLAASFER